jgi:hypothetical protein
MTRKMAKDKFATLRQQAEDILRGQPANLADLSTADIQALIHPASPPARVRITK